MVDPSALVEGGATGLKAVATRFRDRGFPVRAAYLVKRVTEDDAIDWVLVLVLAPFAPGASLKAIYAHVELRRAGLLPKLDERVRIEAVSIDHVEASRLLAAARLQGRPPVVLSETYYSGLYIHDAIVAEDDLIDAEAA
jgi:hypothetical protein